MVKSELIEAIAMKADISHVKAEEVVSLFFDTITKTLVNGE